MQFEVAVAAQQIALGHLFEDSLPCPVRQRTKIELERLRPRQAVVERQGCMVAGAAAALACPAERSNQVELPVPAAMLLHGV